MALNSVQRVKLVKNYQIIVKNATKYMKTENVVLNTQKQEKSTLFLSLFEKCEKKDRNIVKYYISKFPDLFNFCKKDLGKVALLLRKGVIGHDYIDS